MSHQFEPQTEQQANLLVQMEIPAPPAITPASSPAPERRNVEETLPVSETVMRYPQEQTSVLTVGENWQALLQEWQQENRGGLLHKLSNVSLGVAGVSVPLFFLISGSFGQAPTLHSILFLSWLALWTVIFTVEMRRQRDLNPKQTAILSGLTVAADTRAAGPLLEAWQSAATNGPGRAQLGKILLRLLPQLRREDGIHLTPQQRRMLYDNIAHTKTLYHPDIAFACLEAIEQIGDIHALPLLARLVVHDAPTPQEQRLRERAKQCLTHLTQNLDFGTKANIPNWIAKLPYISADKNRPNMRAGADDALIALFALTQLLPQLQPSDAGLLKAGQREYLAESWRWILYALCPSYPAGSSSLQQARLGSAFSFAVLHTLEQIGTGRDIILIEGLLDVPVEELPQLRLKARSVSAILERRREKEQAGQTLLRAASAPFVAPSELLRPANAGQTSSDPKELLRPEG